MEDRVGPQPEGATNEEFDRAHPVPSTWLGWMAEARHLILLAAVFLAAIAAFLLLRRAVVPEGFGLYGHYRPGALDDNQLRPLAFAGQSECAICHDDAVTSRSEGKHKVVSCEACHGPQARHAADPSAVRPPKVGSVALCAGCHERDSAKPVQFPQVVAAEHSGGEACGSCHQPHRPKL